MDVFLFIFNTFTQIYQKLVSFPNYTQRLYKLSCGTHGRLSAGQSVSKYTLTFGIDA